MNRFITSAYMLECSNLWHYRLGYLNVNTLKTLVSLNLLPKLELNSQNKAESCVEAKLIKAPFHYVD